MELFQKARVVRLRSHHDKYLLADDDEQSVCQDRNGTTRNAMWTIDRVASGGDGSVLRLKSCFGKYLTASNMPFLLGLTGKQVLQTMPTRLDASVEWEPIREGFQVRLRTRYGQFLRANNGLPPWRNSITHDVPHRSSTQDWVLWEIDIVEIRAKSPRRSSRSLLSPPTPLRGHDSRSAPASLACKYDLSPDRKPKGSYMLGSSFNTATPLFTPPMTPSQPPRGAIQPALNMIPAAIVETLLEEINKLLQQQNANLLFLSQMLANSNPDVVIPNFQSPSINVEGVLKALMAQQQPQQPAAQEQVKPAPLQIEDGFDIDFYID